MTKHILVTIHRPVSNKKNKMCRHYGYESFPTISILVINSLHKQFMKYGLLDGGGLCMIYITYGDCFDVAMKCFLATIDGM